MKIPANIYEMFCPHCGGRVEYPLFQASFYDYDTYLEIVTRTLVRIDLEGVHYTKSSIADLLSKYAQKEFPNQKNVEWINLSEERVCEICKSRFLSSEGINPRFCLEEKIKAKTLP